jgi:mycofactocin precursor
MSDTTATPELTIVATCERVDQSDSVEDSPIEQDMILEDELLVEDVSIDGMCGVY